MKNKEKQEKKFNPYNLFVYGFKATCIFGLILFLFALLTVIIQWFQPLPKTLESVFAILVLIDFGMFLIFIYFIDVYQKKITTYIEKPKKPYKIELKSINIALLLKKELKTRNFETFQKNDCNVYYRKTHKWYFIPNNEINILVECSQNEVDKHTKNYIVKTRQWVNQELKEKNSYRQIIIFLKIPKMEEEFWKYLMDRTMEYYNNFMLLAVLVEDESCIYIPYPTMAQWNHHNMKKLLKDVLKEKIIGERNRY